MALLPCSQNFVTLPGWSVVVLKCGNELGKGIFYLYCIEIHNTFKLALHCTTMHCITLHCTELKCSTIHCTTLHCTSLYCTLRLHRKYDMFTHILATLSTRDPNEYCGPSLMCTVYNAQQTSPSAQCTVHSARCSIHYVQCIVL